MFLYLANDVVSPLLTPHILTLHVYLLMMSEAPVLVILICICLLLIKDLKFYIKEKVSLQRQNVEELEVLVLCILLVMKWWLE